MSGYDRRKGLLNAGIVVGETSGDLLAAALVPALRKHFPDLTLTGVVGPKLIENGARALFKMDRLSFMGFIDPLLHLPEIYWMRRSLIQYFLQNRPDVFIGVDAPDFNLGLERILRQNKIKTVHYVSPTVWAWRQGRIHKIREAVDLMLALFPFEAEFYQKYNVPVCFTGHPFADQIPLEIDVTMAKAEFGFGPHQKLVALLPGSRNSEIKYLAKSYIETAKWCYERDKTLIFLAPLVSEEHKLLFETLCLKHAPLVPIQVMLGNARAVMSASDVALVTSGTATLELLLYKKPMVVAYRMNPITFQVAKRLVKVPYISQPNLLAGEHLVEEFIQGEVQPQKLGEALFKCFEKGREQDTMIQKFTEIHLKLRRNAAEVAAEAIAELVGPRK